MTSPFIYLLLLVDVVLTVSAQLMLRAGAVKLHGAEFSFGLLLEPFRNGFLFAGVVLYAVSFFLYVFLLSRLQLNIVYPIATGTILVLITLSSYLFLKETLTTIQLVGIVTILTGIVLVLLPK